MKILCPKCDAENDTENAVAGMIRCQCGEWFREPATRNAFQVGGTAPMARTKPCPSCGKMVSLQADSCPGCGHAFRYAGGIRLSDPVHVAGLITCVILAALVVAYILYVC